MNSPTIFDELNETIDRLLAGAATDDVTPGVAELLEVVPDLRHLPRADFKARLMVELEWEASGRTISAPSLPAVSDARNPQADLDLVQAMAGGVGGFYPVRGKNIAASVALHAAMLLFVGLGVVMVKTTARVPEPGVAGATMIDPYIPPVGFKPNHGGGGGGAADKLGASKGEAPRFAQQQFTPPAVEIHDPTPKLPVEATLIGPPQLTLPNAQTGDPLSNLVAPSSGAGVSGVGSGRGDGVGPGNGPGRGPGSGGGSGGDFYLPGQGVSAPRAIYSPEPEFSDEARRVKFQGTVTLSAVIGADGRARNIRVARSLGMGLDEKASEAVRTWRFQPGTKDGRPVPVQIEIEVDFHLY
jgi:TonB family protein